jgi:hypothetical protein
MNGWKRVFGLDVVNTLLVAGGSFFVVIGIAELTHNDGLSLGAAALCAMGYGILRHYALQALPPEEETSGSWRMADVEARLAELEALQHRVAELEERVDFSERLLAAGQQRPVEIERKG